MSENWEIYERKILDAIKKSKGNSPCPRCDNDSFQLVKGFFKHPIQHRFDQVALGGPGLTTIALVCPKCGFVAEHALDFLGLEDMKEAVQ